MKLLFITIFICCSLCLFYNCNSTIVKKNEVQIVDLQQLNKYLTKDDKLYIVNFWATWCKPCVAELPYFERLNDILKNKNAEIILVSLDFEEDLESKLLPFVKNENIKSKVMLLNEGKPVYWIDKVNKNWSGAIPATLLFSKKLEKNGYLGIGNFYEGEITFENLNKWVNLNLAQL